MKDIDVLIEALPYIKKFHDKKILIYKLKNSNCSNSSCS